MEDTKKLNRVVIIMDGGIITNIFSDQEIDFLVIDDDIESIDPEFPESQKLIEYQNNTSFVNIPDNEVNSDEIDEIFELVNSAEDHDSEDTKNVVKISDMFTFPNFEGQPSSVENIEIIQLKDNPLKHPQSAVLMKMKNMFEKGYQDLLDNSDALVSSKRINLRNALHTTQILFQINKIIDLVNQDHGYELATIDNITLSSEKSINFVINIWSDEHKLNYANKIDVVEVHIPMVYFENFKRFEKILLSTNYIS